MLARIQALLERIYDLPTAVAVEDFLISDPEHARRLQPRGRQPQREALLLRESADGLDLSLFIHRRILDRLQHCDPFGELGRHNLDAFWVAVEGVSHLLYLVWCANAGRSVTLLEMELQAEVDKFVLSTLLIALQNGGRAPRRLHGLLFDSPVLSSELSEEDRERYRDANRYAARSCLTLSRRYLRRPGLAGLGAELREFYRLAKQPRLRHIENVRVT